MAGARDVQGTVFQNATATFLARVEDSVGSQIGQADVGSVEYTISEVALDVGASQSSVVGHERVALAKADVIFNTLQTDASWTVDSIGYNFRHEIDVSQYEAFLDVGKTYQVRYQITPVTGQKIVFRFQVRCI